MLHRALIVLIATSTATVQAAEWKIDPTLRFSAGYNDNLRLSIDDKISSAEATFTPSALFSVSTPTSSASGNVRFDFRRFEDNSDLDDDNVRLNIGLFHRMERSRLGLNLGFTKDTSLDSQLEETGLTFDRIPRQRVALSPNWTYSFSDRTSVSSNLSYSDVEYKNSGGTGFTGFTSNSGQVSLSHVLNERVTASLTLSGSQTDNDNDVKSTNANLQGGATYRFDETLSASLFVGYRGTKTEFSSTSRIPIFAGNQQVGFFPVPQDVSNNSSGSTFNASITKILLRGEIGLSASRNISNASSGEPIEVTRLRLTSRYKFTDLFSARLNMSISNSETQNNIGSSQNRDYYQIEPSLSWAVKKFWSLSGSYRYRKQTFGDISDDATQNAAYLTLTYLWPRIAVSR